MKIVLSFILTILLILDSSMSIAQTQISDFEYSQQDSVRVNFNLMTKEGNNNIIYLSKLTSNESSFWQENHYTYKIFLNKIDKNHEILSNLNIKLITDLKTNEDGSLSILIASDNRMIYSIRSVDKDNYLIEDSIQVKNIKCTFCSTNNPKYFQNNILYFSDGKLFQWSNRKSSFIIDASSGGYEWYVSDKSSYAFIARYGYVIFNGDLFKGNFTYTNSYFINNGKLFFNSLDLYEIEKGNKGLIKTKIEKKEFGVLTKPNNNVEFYSSKTKADTIVKFLWQKVDSKFSIVDSVKFVNTQSFIGNNFEANFKIRMLFQTGFLGGSYRNLIRIKSKNYQSFTFSWSYTTDYAEIKILNMNDEKVVFVMKELNSSESYIFVNLTDSTKAQIFSSNFIKSGDYVEGITSSIRKILNLKKCDLIEESIPRFLSKGIVIPQSYHLKLNTNSVSVLGISPLNKEKYLVSEDSFLIQKFDSSFVNSAVIATHKVNVFYPNDIINKELFDIRDKEVTIIDKESKKVFKLALPFKLKKNYNDYSILFPNSNIALFNTDKGIYCYNFSNFNFILLGEYWKYQIDRSTNGIIVFNPNPESYFNYYYFDENSTKLSKHSYILNEYISVIEYFDSIIRFGNGTKDLLFQINKAGNLNKIKKFWHDNIYAFGKNENEILAFTFDKNFKNYTVYSNINTPLKIPDELRVYGFPSHRFSGSGCILFFYFTNDFNKIVKFKFNDRKFYNMDEDILSTNLDFLEGPLLKNTIIKDGKIYYYYLKNKDKLLFESNILFENQFNYNHDYLNYGPNKGAYVFASEERKNPQIYKLKESNVDFKWLPFETDYTNLIEEYNFEAVLYPNPSSGFYSILSDQEIDKIQIFNLLGQKVLETFGSYNINISFLNKGLYLVKIYSGDKFITERLVKQ